LTLHGHVDFTYEVSRCLAACEGAILIVDSTQGVQAQTVSNVYLAMENNLTIIPVINKIDLASSMVEETKEQIENILAIDTTNCPLISAKTGLNINDVLESIVKNIPCPKINNNDKLSALIFDSIYDNYKGAIAFLKIKSGEITKGMEITTMSNNKKWTVVEVGVFKAGGYTEKDKLVAGEVGYIACSIKNVCDVSVGDTITSAKDGPSEPLPRI